jgi:CTP synthase (UTP-ammonia lyase)
LAVIFGTTEITEEYFCNFEVNPAYHRLLQAAGIVPVAFGEQGEWRAVELPGMRFFLATLFLPQHSSTPERPHPLMVAFVTAARDSGRARAR